MSGGPETGVRQRPVWATAWLRRACGLLLASVIGAAACSEATTPMNLPTETPAELQAGESAFNTFCARCHGERALGTNQGPPLVHKVYEPSHHGDAAFYRAAAQGVRAHHWQFGNMPKVDGITEEDVTQIIRYVRWLQRQAGIF